MQSRPAIGKPLTAEQRGQLEADYTYQRLYELDLEPVRGNFDAAHLKEVNRRIFQDLPGAGFADVTPGEFRKPVPDAVDWMKQRGLSTVDGAFHVAYSRMDDAATARLDKALEGAKPDELRGLKTVEFTARLAKIYACVVPETYGVTLTAIKEADLRRIQAPATRSNSEVRRHPTIIESIARHVAVLLPGSAGVWPPALLGVAYTARRPTDQSEFLFPPNPQGEEVRVCRV